MTFNPKLVEERRQEGVSMYVVDPFGATCSYFEELAATDDSVFLFSGIQATKAGFIDMLSCLHEQGIVQADEGDESWPQTAKRLRSNAVGKIVERIAESLPEGSMMMFEKMSITEKRAEILKPIMSRAIVVLVNQQPPSEPEVLQYFQVVDVSQASVDVEKMLWSEIPRDAVADSVFLENRIRFLCGEDPGKLSVLLGQLTGKASITLQAIRALHLPSNMVSKLNMTPMVLLVALVFLGARGCALAQDDPRLYIVAYLNTFAKMGLIE